jgi:CspA family cold shock protein
MPTGTVKWFNNAKGYGFILSSDGVSDIFAHYSAITMDGYKTLKAGQEVSYDLIEGEKGLHATNIAPLNDSSVEPENRADNSTQTSGLENP